MFTTAWTSGAAGSLWYILPVIVLVALLVILLETLNSGKEAKSPEGRRRFLGSLVGLGVAAILIGRMGPIVLDALSDVPELLVIESSDVHQLDGDESYTGIRWESGGRLTLAEGSRVTLRE